MKTTIFALMILLIFTTLVTCQQACTDPCNLMSGAMVTFCGNDGNTHVMPISAQTCYQHCNISAVYAHSCECPNFCSSFVNLPSQGSCTSQNCACNAGYAGQDCSLISCPSNSCNNHGKCIANDGSSFADWCQCSDGYISGHAGCLSQYAQVENLPYKQVIPGDQYTALDKYGDEHPVFNKTTIASIHVQIAEHDLQRLVDPATLKQLDWIPVNFTFENDVIRAHLNNVGIAVKGQASAPKPKKSFKFAFNKFGNKERRFYGLKHLHTKAGCNGDDSFVRLPVPLEFQRALNLPAQRFGYAAVYVNHRYYGFAWVGEEIDDVFLQSRYNHSDGNLYKVTSIGTMQYLGDDPNTYANLIYTRNGFPTHVYNQISGDGDYTDFAALVKLLNMSSSDPQFEQALHDNFALDSFAYNMAISMSGGNWDSLFRGNNYMLYKNPKSEKWHVLMHGFEEVWDEISSLTDNIYSLGIRGGDQWPKLLQVASFRSKFTNAVRLVMDQFLTNAKLEQRMRAWFTMVTPYVIRDRMYQLSGHRSAEDFLHIIDDLVTSIQVRNTFTLEQLE